MEPRQAGAGGPGQPRGKARARLAGRGRSVGGVQAAQAAAVQRPKWLNERRVRGAVNYKRFKIEE